MMTISVTAAQPMLCIKNHSILSTKSFSPKLFHCQSYNATINSEMVPEEKQKRLHLRTVVCGAARRKSTVTDTNATSVEGNNSVRRVLQFVLWGAEAVYILWLFLLPYAPVRVMCQSAFIFS